MADFSKRIQDYAVANGQEVALTKPHKVTIATDGTYSLPMGGVYALKSVRMLDLNNAVDVDIIGSTGGMLHVDSIVASQVEYDYEVPIFTGHLRILSRGMIAGELYVLQFIQVILQIPAQNEVRQ